jgi:hypothetical protein
VWLKHTENSTNLINTAWIYGPRRSMQVLLHNLTPYPASLLRRTRNFSRIACNKQSHVRRFLKLFVYLEAAVEWGCNSICSRRSSAAVRDTPICRKCWNGFFGRCVKKSLAIFHKSNPMQMFPKMFPLNRQLSNKKIDPIHNANCFCYVS